VALRKAFLGMVRDPEFVAEAKKIGLDPEPQPGEELQSAVTDTLDATGEAVQKLREVTQPPR
jgi:tripartite-type tricarboxylate transporter receptor subunit TctC